MDNWMQKVQDKQECWEAFRQCLHDLLAREDEIDASARDWLA